MKIPVFGEKGDHSGIAPEIMVLQLDARQREATELIQHTRAMTTLAMRGVKFGIDSLSDEEKQQLIGWYGIDWQQFYEWAAPMEASNG